jgi:spore germination cell wall hydrolase CwlJ-like protein
MNKYFLGAFACVVALSSSTIKWEMNEEPLVTNTEAPPLDTKQRISMDDVQFDCLAQSVYFEARDQSLHGQAAVAMVILNRVEDDFWPDSVCGVIRQGSYSTGRIELNKCQFSWYCDGLSDYPRDRKTWHSVNSYLREVLLAWNAGYDITYGATNFHSTAVSPDWRSDRNMEYVVTIDDHVFYYWNRGKTVAFN